VNALGDQSARRRFVEELDRNFSVVAAAGASEAPAEYRIEVPAAEEWLTPFVHLLVVQLLSYYVAIGRGSNPDTGREDHPQHARARIHFKL